MKTMLSMIALMVAVVLMGCGCWPKEDKSAEPKALTSLRTEVNQTSAEELKKGIYLEKLEVLKRELGASGDARGAAKVQDEIDSIKNPPAPVKVAVVPATPAETKK